MAAAAAVRALRCFQRGHVVAVAEAKGLPQCCRCCFFLAALQPCSTVVVAVGKAWKRVERRGRATTPRRLTLGAGCRSSECIVLSGSADVYRRIEVIPSAAPTLPARLVREGNACSTNAAAGIVRVRFPTTTDSSVDSAVGCRD